MNTTGRLESLDALRGFDMLFIMGFATFVVKACAAFGFAPDCWLVRQMQHPDWLGLTHHDTIFPLFIFIAGAAFPFSYAKQREKGASTAHVLWKIFRRLMVLVLLGMVYERFFSATARPFRFGSVLARIGITGAAASVLYVFFRARTRAVTAVAILLGYWVLTAFVGAPDHPGASHFTPEGNIAVYVDRTFLAPWSRLSPGTAALPFDNQGLLSTVAAVVTALLGVFTGEYVRGTRGRVSGDRQTVVLLAAAGALAVVGCAIAWGFGRYSFPFSKVLWSPSFTLVVGAYSVAAFAAFYWLIDVRRIWTHTLFFRVIGLNAITIYLAQPLFGISSLNASLFGRMAGWFPPAWAAVFLGATYMFVCWTLLYVLYRKQVFLKV